MHTREPERLFAILRPFSASQYCLKEKVEDMRIQGRAPKILFISPHGVHVVLLCQSRMPRGR